MEHIVSSLGSFTQAAIAIITIIAVFLHLRWNRSATTLGPTLLTTFGIFFCFGGIAWGLLSFDPNDIKGSVPLLLQGIRTSFWASVFGIGWALTIKMRVLILGGPKIPIQGSASGATIDDLAEQLVRLNRSIAGTEDSTLLSQVKLLRTDGNDRLDRLSQSFDRFAQTMAEANSKALIQALSEIIRDFNTKLNEQFGDNFKQLNIAVERLVMWQVQYKESLDELIKQETITRRSMTEASLRYADLVNKSTAFVSTAESLGSLLTTASEQSERLNAALRSLAELITAASHGLPQIETKIVEMTHQISQGVRSNQETLGSALKASAQSIQANNQELTTLLKTSLESANRELNSHIKQSTEDSKRQIVALDKALEEELTKSIETLGRQLAALSQKFVQDYTPLTVQLQRLLKVATA